jgi:hypothetical protein
MGKRSRKGKVQSTKHLQKKAVVKNVLLVSKTTLQHFLYRILTQFVWIVFQEKYEVFRHLIKDNKKNENNKINKQYGQVRF